MKMKAKLASLLMALTFVFACLGVGALVANDKAIDAKASTDYTITHLTALGSSGTTFIYAYPTNESKPTANSWDHAFTFVSNSGDGFLWNGEAYTGWELKQPGDFYIGLGDKNATAGDELVLDGTFYNETLDMNIKFVKCGLRYNGSSWESFTPPTVHDIGALILHVNSSVGGAKGNNAQLYLTRKDNGALPVQNWGVAFVADSPDNFTKNGTAATLHECKSTGDGFWFNFDGLNAGDYVTISGTYFCEAENVRYVVSESMFIWNGSGWEVGVVYTTYNVGKLTVHNSSSNGGAGTRADHLYMSSSIVLPVQSWDYAFSFVSGDGLKKNGESYALSEIKSPDGVIWMAFGAVSAGDVISISGTFACESQGVKYVIEESKFVWNGTIWENYVDYAVYNIGKVVIGGGSGAGAVYFDKASGTAFEVTEGTWTEKLTFETGSGAGITLNGNQIAMGDIKIPNNIYVGLGTTATTGDILVIEGTFYNKTLAVKYVIEESKFKWNGSEWVAYSEIVTHNIGALAPHGNLNAGGNGVIYLKRADNGALPVLDWEAEFLAESAENFKVNGVNAELIKIRSTGDGFYWQFAELNAGDYITISGTFVCASKNVKYVIEESSFLWNGTGWEEYVDYTVYTITKVGAGNGTTASALYLYTLEGDELPKLEGDWDAVYTLVAGNGFVLNGVVKNVTDIKMPGDLYVGLGFTASVGDVLVIDGTYVNANKSHKFVFENCALSWNGTTWLPVYTDNLLASYDLVHPIDIGIGSSLSINNDIYDGTQKSYVTSPSNTTGSVKFRFNYNSSNPGVGCIAIRLRGTEWEGVHFRVIWAKAGFVDSEVGSLESNTDYVIEFGAIDLADGSGTWVYVSIDGAILYSEKQALSAYNTSRVSIYSDAGTFATISDTRSTLTYTTSEGDFVEYVEKNSTQTLAKAKTYKTFIGWVVNGELYQAGDEISVGDTSVTATALELDFVMEDGAAIRIASTSEESGIRFTSKISATELNALVNTYGATVTYGTIILPLDYLSAGQEPNLDDTFTNILVLESTYSEDEDGYTVFRGAMASVLPNNYDRLFAGRAYLTVTFADGDTMTVYSPFSYENNVRSVRYVASQYIADNTSDFADLDVTKQEIINTYAEVTRIKLIDYNAHVKDSFNVTAWYYPELDSSNGYNNVTNIEIAQAMVDAGIKTVILDGEYHIDLNTAENIVKTRQIIEFFWSQGLQTIAFGSNSSASCNIDFASKGYPDFSDCEGFIGFMIWDEPKDTNFEKLAELACAFDKEYAGTGVIYMTNLLPSYAGEFNGTSNWWESSVSSLDRDSYKAYLQGYCETVLSQISSEKWLSMDSYPINTDKSLTANFLFDLAMTKYYSLEYDATSHAVLQSSGWTEDGNSSKSRMPSTAEMRMQAYSAMAFGIDSISWWSYSDKRNDNQNNPTDSDEYYGYFKEINTELSAIASLYSAFDWKGVILGMGTDNGRKVGNFVISTDLDYEAYNLVNGQIGAYQLSATDTKYLSSVSTNKTDWNYLMGVMEDVVGNEAYVLCNYNSHEEDRAQTITITFNTNITEVMIYRGGVKQIVSVNNQTLTVNLATGEGVIIIPSAMA